MTSGRAVMAVMANRRAVVSVMPGRWPEVIVMAAGADYDLRHANPYMYVDICLCGGAEQPCRKGEP